MNWFVQICLALKHVHDRKILHRDIKTQVSGTHTPTTASLLLSLCHCRIYSLQSREQSNLEILALPEY